MAITNLTGYKWVGNQTLDLSFINANNTSVVYNISCKLENTQGESVVSENIEFYYKSSPFNISVFKVGDIDLYLSWGGWNNSYKPSATLTFTGGTDATNTELIAWLEANGTLTKPVVLQLAPFLTNIANAIRKKKGTTAPINAQDFAKEIESIETAAKGYTLTMNVSSNNTYVDNIAYAINNEETYTNFSSSQAGTAITLNNVVSITFKDNYRGFAPEPYSGVKIGSTSGGEEYGTIALNGGETLTIDLTQDTTIYVEDTTISKPAPSI